MARRKKESGKLDARKERPTEEVEQSVQNCIDILKESRAEVDTFVENEVIPALNEIKTALQEQFRHVSIDYPVDRGISLAATITMASGAELPEQPDCTDEVEYRVELGQFTGKAKGSLVMKDVVPGQVEDRDLVIRSLEIGGSGDAGNVFGITRADITRNFRQIYNDYVAQPLIENVEHSDG